MIFTINFEIAYMKTKPEKVQPAPLAELLLLNKEQNDHLSRVVAEYRGQVPVLESALGALIVGQHYGTRILQLAHGQATLKKYETILGMSFADLCPEKGRFAYKSIGLKAAEKLGGFWKVVTGKEKVERKGEVDDV